MRNFIVFALIMFASIVGYATQTLSPLGTFALASIGSTFIELPKGILAVTFTTGICEKIQSSLIDIMKQKAPQLNRTKVGYLDFLLSPQNTAGVQVIPIDQGNGKKRTVRVKYLQRGLESDIIDDAPEGCTTSLEKEPKETDVDIENYKGTKGLKFTEDEMRKLCEADSVYINNVIRAEIDPLIVSLDKSLIALQATNFGKFNPDVSPADYKTVNLLYGDRDEPLYIGEKKIITDFENLNASGRPSLIGSGKLDDYAMQQKIGCCNDYGVNLAGAGNFDYFNDRFVGSVLGDADKFIAAMPGYVQLLTWNKYVGTYMKENATFSHTTLIDPFTGLKFDMKIHYDDCNEFFYMQFGLWYELFFLPTDAFAYGDELAGVNYTLQYQAAKLSS